MTPISKVSRGLFFLSAYVCLPMILVLIGVDVTLRYVFNAPLVWAQEASTITLFMAIILALPESWRRDVHIRADFLTTMMRPGLNNALARLVWLILLGVSVLIVIQCWSDIELMILFNERSTDLGLPLHWFRGALGVVGAVCAVLAGWKLLWPRPSGDPVRGDAL
ncbi:TRAP transporter small permease [Pontivivens nitratireducens]|uniref:TRAP transporter small permease protein n=1 Tax=Pontivivens nitratireducens TaxID=2758038 RepID=A0A6G7VRF3_9RHOB|nr:TRAP transporter small permease [Pontibrevibacter nitratireducens]QIK42591.1 TRAP transporter small permease [Pontibrevibacter nitratireducens]